MVRFHFENYSIIYLYLFQINYIYYFQQSRHQDLAWVSHKNYIFCEDILYNLNVNFKLL